MISISYTTKATGLVAISQKSSHALCSRVVCVCTSMQTVIEGAKQWKWQDTEIIAASFPMFYGHGIFVELDIVIKIFNHSLLNSQILRYIFIFSMQIFKLNVFTSYTPK